jgi:hypothetical protein
MGSEGPTLLRARPARRDRIIVAVVLGVVCGLVSLAFTLQAQHPTQDFHVWWLAARVLVAGGNPYTTIDSWTGLGFIYPLPTAIATIPLAWIPVEIAGPVFVAIECGGLAYVLTREQWWPLLMFASASMSGAVVAAQWGPLMTLAVVVPQLSWLGVLKPNFGVAILAARPSLRQGLVILAILATSLALRPEWPREWLAVIGASPAHFAPWRAPGGFLLFAAWLRWRRPEARLLGVLSLMPSSPIAYDTLPLLTIARTRVELIGLCVLSCALSIATSGLSLSENTDGSLRVARPSTTWLMYMPALLMVLRRPNEGDVPTWFDRMWARTSGLLRSAAGN